MDQQKPEEQQKLTPLQKKILEFNKKNPIGSLIKYTDKEKITYTGTLIGSAREEKKNIFVQVSGVEDLLPIESIQPIA